MNEYSVNIPISEYDKLRMCELMLKDSYIKRLHKLSTEYASLSIDSRTNEEYCEQVKCQNKLLALLNSEYFQIMEQPDN